MPAAAQRRFDRVTALVVILSCCLASRAAAVEVGPQGVVRQFCQADGLGQRVSIRGWASIAPLVAWSLEPAWDYVVLITAYTVGAPQPQGNGEFVVEVRYNVVGQVSALGVEAATQVEVMRLQVGGSENGTWRIAGPPPPPHIFSDRVDADQMRRSLEQGGINFTANSFLVQQMFRSAGWNVVYQRTTDLPLGSAYQAIESPKAGDLVVYLRDGTPYHVGLLEGESVVVSSTLNAGVVRTPIGAFAGEVKYLRLTEPEPEPTMVPATPTPAARVVGAPAVTRRPRPTPTRSSRKRKRRGRAARQPSKTRRVKQREGSGRRARANAKPTPVAARRLP